MVTILIMSAKWTALGFPKLKEFCNKGYDITNYIYDVTIKIISRDSNYILDVVTWPKFGSSSITRREVIIASSWPEKTLFLRDTLGSSSIWPSNFTPLWQKG